MKKTQLLETIQRMPEDISIDDLIERLIVLKKIEEGQRQVAAGETMTEEEAKRKLDKWLR